MVHELVLLRLLLLQFLLRFLLRFMLRYRFLSTHAYEFFAGQVGLLSVEGEAPDEMCRGDIVYSAGRVGIALIVW